LRNLLVVKAAPEAEVLIGDAALALDRYREQAGRFETEDLLRLSLLATQMEQSVKTSALPRVQLETGVVRMIRMARSVQLTDVMARLSEMASRVETGDGGEGPGTEASGTEDSSTGDSESPSAQPADPSSGSAPVPSPPPSVAAPSGPALADDEGRSPAASTESSTASSESSAESTESSAGAPATTASSESSTATQASPKLDLQTARNRWPAIVDEITRQRNGLGILLAEAVLTACSPPDDAGPEGPCRITVRFEAGHVFHMQQIEKRENKSLIQKECSRVLGMPVRIECEIDTPKTEDVGAEMTSSSENSAAEVNTQKTGDAGAGKAAGSSKTDDAEAKMTDGNRADDAEAEMASGIDRADIAGAGLDEYPGSAEEIVSEPQDTTTAGKTGGQAANTRTGAAKDPAVRKIVEAFDGQIVTD
ncbi:MAG: hypothetical protein OXI19_13335, partial [Gemmatimonadota bacterium]|nr:hypothetical protein [Gemmatimonadota bacterium]